MQTRHEAEGVEAVSEAEEFLQSTETLQRRLLDIKDLHEDKA